jgi:hypothetical protein
VKVFVAILATALALAAAAILWPTSGGRFEPEVSVHERSDESAAPAVAPATALNESAATAPTTAPSATAAAAPASTHKSAASTNAPASAALKRVDSDQLEVDGKYTVLGSGTELDPYRITWDLLKSAYETMDLNGPRDTPPRRVAMLNGTWVQISGYLAPPLWGQETSELLVMLNRWDGCCIGLPPTPFDCIEAELLTPMRLGAKHSINYGTIRGRLVVEPYKAGSFLLGLYRLEAAQTDDPKDR